MELLNNSLELIILLFAILAVFAFAPSPRMWAIIIGIELIIATFIPAFLNIAILTPLWLVYLILTVLFNLPQLRHKFVSNPMLKFVQQVLPPMSKTEREALNAGDTWWEGELFAGKPDWKKLLAQPKPQLTFEEQAFIDNQVETLCQKIDDWETIAANDLAPEVWDYIKKEGFFSLVIPKEYGGHGFSALAHSTIVLKIATRSVSVAVTVMVPNSLGPGELLLHYGTQDQKDHYLPRLAKAQEIPCFALTASEAGSDAGAMPDTGIVCRGEFKGKEIIGIRLNWNKRYITLAPIATLLGLAFKMYDPEHLLGDKENIGITVCLIPTDHPGVEIGKRHKPSFMAFMNGTTRGKDVFIPLEWIVGGEEMRGQGWRMLMECLSIGRGISLPALGTAVAKLSYLTTGAYARLREQFKTYIGKFEGVEEAMTRIGGMTYLCEATRVFTLSAIDQGLKPSLATAINKYHLTEMGRQTITDALDVHAGRGVQGGPRNYLSLIYASIPMSITVEGANILTRSLIIFGQGAMRCHPYLRDEIEAAQSKDKINSLKKFDKLFASHLVYSIGNFARVIFYGLTGGKFIKVPIVNDTAKYYRQLTRMSTAFAFIADIAMLVLGGQLKRKERLSARLGDILCQLYMASAVLKYFHDHGSLKQDLPFLRWTLNSCFYKMQLAFNEFFVNFALTHKWVKLLRWVIFPWGNAYHCPSDRTANKIATEMMRESILRKRLTQYCYIGTANESVGRVEAAFQAVLAAEAANTKLQSAIKAGRISRSKDILETVKLAVAAGILSIEEEQLIDAAVTLTDDAIQVDEF